MQSGIRRKPMTVRRYTGSEVSRKNSRVNGTAESTRNAETANISSIPQVRKIRTESVSALRSSSPILMLKSIRSTATTPKGYAQNTAMTELDAAKEEYVDMMDAGIVDPTKVTRSAVQNAASIAATILTTEAVVADVKEPMPAAPAGGMGGMDGMY